MNSKILKRTYRASKHNTLCRKIFVWTLCLLSFSLSLSSFLGQVVFRNIRAERDFRFEMVARAASFVRREGRQTYTSVGNERRQKATARGLIKIGASLSRDLSVTTTAARSSTRRRRMQIIRVRSSRCEEELFHGGKEEGTRCSPSPKVKPNKVRAAVARSNYSVRSVLLFYGRRNLKRVTSWN